MGVFGFVQSGLKSVNNWFSGNRASAKANNQAWRRTMEASNTSYQRGVADMKAAGLNPMLAYSQGGASTPQANPAGTQAAGSEVVKAYSGISAAAAQRSVAQATTANLAANTVKQGQETVTSAAQAKDLEASADLKRAQAENERGGKKDLYGAQKAQIEKSLEKIDAEITVASAQVKNLGANTDLARARAQETMTNIRSALKDIDIKQMTLDQKKGLYESIKSKLEAEANIKASQVQSARNEEAIDKTKYGQYVRPVLKDVAQLLGIATTAAGAFLGARGGRGSSSMPPAGTQPEGMGGFPYAEP